MTSLTAKHLFLISMLGTMTTRLMAQTIEDYPVTDDLTQMIQNSDFSEGTPITTLVYLNDYNLYDDGAGAGGTGLFGMQDVPGWTALAPSDNILWSDGRTDDANGKKIIIK